MALPKITHPVYKITVPSTKKQLSFRPYTVREEKLLLMIKDDESIQEKIDVLKQVIVNCCVEDIDVSKLAIFDIEYIFIKMRAKSVGEIIELNYTKENNRTTFDVDLNRVEVKFDPNHKRQFLLSGDIGVNMNYPTFDSMVKMDEMVANNQNVDDFVFDMFIDCIDTVFDNEKVYKEFTKEELSEFVLSLPRDSIDNIKNFFETMPVLEHQVPVKFKDGTTEVVTMRGLKDFFIF